MKQSDKMSAAKRLKLITVVLAVLLVLSAGGLAARHMHRKVLAPPQVTAEVQGNRIGEKTSVDESSRSEEATASVSDEAKAAGTKDTFITADSTDVSSDRSQTSGTVKTAVGDRRQGTVLELYKGKSGDNQRFEVKNMFPGDTLTQNFCIRVSHDQDLELFFRADVTEQTKKLGDVLRVKVTHLETDKVLYDAAFSAVNGKEIAEVLKANSEESTIANYQIEVSLDTSVGNEYQVSMLQADFHWYVKDADEGGLVPPKTNDPFHSVLWIVLIASVLLLLVVLWRQRREVRHE